VTKKNEDGKTKKRNQTAHQRAMANPKIREAVSALQSNWDDLSPGQLGEQLQRLVYAECSVKGLARDLGKPESNLRRHIELVNPSRSRSDSKAEIKRTSAKEPEKRSVTSSLKAAIESRNMFFKKKAIAPAVQKPDPPNEPQHPAMAQRAKMISNPASIVTKAPLVVVDGLARQESPAEEERPPMSPLESYNSATPSLQERMQQLASLPDSIPSRPFRDARSMKRQGRPLPPTDRA
jgi:hypothetical protein